MNQIKVFNCNMRTGPGMETRPHAETVANEWLRAHPEAKVVSFTYWEGWPPGWDDYHTKVELVLEVDA